MVAQRMGVCHRTMVRQHGGLARLVPEGTLDQLRKHELERLRKNVLRELKVRYRKRGGAPKYGLLNKGFERWEAGLFFEQITNEKALLIFLLQIYLGLSIHEGCKLEAAHVDLLQRRLWIESCKGRYKVWVYLHDRIWAPLLAYYQGHEAEIRRTGYFFPGKNTYSKYPYVSPDWVRREFRDAREAAGKIHPGLLFSYGLSEERDPHRRPRRLFRLTSHSLRHSFVTRVHETTGDLLVTAKLARHVNPRNTMRYVHKSQDVIDETLKRTFAKDDVEEYFDSGEDF